MIIARLKLGETMTFDGIFLRNGGESVEVTVCGDHTFPPGLHFWKDKSGDFLICMGPEGCLVVYGEARA